MPWIDGDGTFGREASCRTRTGVKRWGGGGMKGKRKGNDQKDEGRSVREERPGLRGGKRGRVAAGVGRSDLIMLGEYGGRERGYERIVEGVRGGEKFVVVKRGFPFKVFGREPF